MLILSLLLACDEEAPARVGGDDGLDSGQETAALIEPPAYSGGTCPALEAGGNPDFQSGEDQRTFQLVLPAEPQGAPVVFVWHWLGGNGRQILNYGGFDAFAEEHGAIVIAPETRGIPYEWDTFDGANTPDLLFFDDMLSCVSEQLGADLSRVYSTGMSAGGLWTVTLSHYRSSWLAASAPLSGGATAKDWSPEESIPMMLTWGGPTDIYGSGASAFSFDDANILLADQLAESGHFQVHCVHSNGHTLPPGGSDYVWSFFEAHPKGVASSPWSDALPGSLPDWCSLPE